MEDNIKQDVAAQPVVETDTTQTSSPQVEAQPTVAQTNDSSDVEATMSPEQRKAFQEMRLEVKRLKEETQGRLTNESAFAPFKYQAPTNEPTGYIDDATRIRAEAAQAAREEMDEFMARQKFPHLFKDKEIEQEIADRWFSSKMRGENVSISDVAEKVNRRFQSVTEKAQQLGAQKALEQVTPKEQAALSASSLSSSAANSMTSSEDLENLRFATRLGKEDAIVARLKSIPWANK